MDSGEVPRSERLWECLDHCHSRCMTRTIGKCLHESEDLHLCRQDSQDDPKIAPWAGSDTPQLYKRRLSRWLTFRVCCGVCRGWCRSKTTFLQMLSVEVSAGGPDAVGSSAAAEGHLRLPLELDTTCNERLRARTARHAGLRKQRHRCSLQCSRIARRRGMLS